MRIAVIDLGTNTFNLLIAETRTEKGFVTIYNEKLPVRLGEGGINSGVITPEAYMRGLEAMDTYAESIRQWRVDKKMAFATSAVRNASNGEQFADDVFHRTAIRINIISGDEEARYIYIGVKQALEFREENSLILDIGGGSTEFILANSSGLIWKQSFEIGASRLLQRFTPSDPILDSEIEEITSYLGTALEPLKEIVQEYPVQELIGASGSFESLAEMVLARFYNGEEFDSTEFVFDIGQCEIIHRQLLSSTREQRLQIKGLVAMRVDMIVISSILVEFIIRELGIPHMRMSAYALKEGVLHEFLEGKGV
ncbi:MAG TPA: phosphatase [Bacteroidia bacterium]|nr:phosphatase [Bacteroidia bacterium]